MEILTTSTWLKRSLDVLFTVPENIGDVPTLEVLLDVTSAANMAAISKIIIAERLVGWPHKGFRNAPILFEKKGVVIAIANNYDTIVCRNEVTLHTD